MTTQQEGKNDIIADENTPFAKAAVRDVRTIIIYIVVTFPSAGCPRPVGRPFYNIFILFFPLRSIAVVLFCLTVSFFFFCPPLRYGITCIDNTPIQKYSRPPVVTLLLLSTLAVAIVHHADVFSSSSSNNNKTIHTMVSVPRVGFDKAVATVAVATVTSDDISCATEVPGEGPYCDGGSIGYCTQVCDYLLTCDDGYVPEPFYLTDDEATWFPETSDYQPHSCHCRGYEDHNGCFCHQIRDMIYHDVDDVGIGSCDPCPLPTPSPTHSPTKPPPPTVWVNDNYCVAASGPWPAGSVSQIKGSQIADGASNGSYVTCFTDMVGGYCWSHSYNYNNNGDWKPCTPYGGGWETYSPMTGRIDSYTAYGPPITIFTLSPVATCGTACTEFSSDVFQ